jgi:SAM-dependent methyltransferase
VFDDGSDTRLGGPLRHPCARLADSDRRRQATPVIEGSDELTPPCGHGAAGLRADRHRLRCSACGSFFDREFLERSFVYDADYPEQRGHFDPEVGAMKVRSLERWLRAVNIDPAGQVVCEVGFGGGYCLQWLAARAAHAFGVEAVEANLAHARGLGVEDVRRFADCRAPLPRPVDLWLFLDSFEHLPEPRAFLCWLAASSGPRARVLLVAPEAGSASERWLGRLWPHRLPDHRFHWSRPGLEALYREVGFRRVAEFRPTKTVSGAMVVNHLGRTFPRLGRLAGTSRWLRGIRLAFNVGEMGLVLEHEPSV